jgi:hypothetical protein
LDAHHAASTFDQVSDEIDQTTDTDQLNALVQSAQALASRMDAEDARHALDQVLKKLNDTTDSGQLNALGRSAPQMNANGSGPPLDHVRYNINQSAEAYRFEAYARAAQGLAQAGVYLDGADAGRALLNGFSGATRAANPKQRRAFGQAVRALAEASGLMDSHIASRVFLEMLDTIGLTSGDDESDALDRTAGALERAVF